MLETKGRLFGKNEQRMPSREKILKALNHEVGPVPMDFGSTPITGWDTFKHSCGAGVQPALGRQGCLSHTQSCDICARASSLASAAP
ncbi:MAG: hypothetical protein KAH99_03865, partial [Verrucomicrobia bacterium]|nr:hypothetical protein [Verrucomicrobiota bacterium]